MAVHGCGPEKSCEEARGREKGATILVILRLGLNIPGGQDRGREEESVKVTGRKEATRVVNNALTSNHCIIILKVLTLHNPAHLLPESGMFYYLKHKNTTSQKVEYWQACIMKF